MGKQKTKGAFLEIRGMKYDLAILGSGLGGSITALIANQMGLRTVLIEKGSHPRFAIGESSTPQADIALANIAETYNLPRLKPLTRYGSWKETYPELNCGPKRGFTYIHHPNIDHELLVAASPDGYDCDSQWYRADLDAFLVNEVKETGIDYFENTEVKPENLDGWQLSSENFSCTADFLIDATGGANPLGIPQDISSVRTNSRAIYAHFESVTPWGNLHGNTNHPYPCHDAALHHVFSGGWMYVLHFDNGITSAGFVLDCEARPNDTWETLMDELPFIKEQFQNAKPTMPIVTTSRMQRCATQMVGENWAMLPYSAAFLDPLHSVGNAHTLCGIERLMPILRKPDEERAELLREYQATTLHEVDLLDKIIHGCYKCFDNFELLSNYAMLYFAGADFAERQRRGGKTVGFLASGDPAFCSMVDESYTQVLDGTFQTNGIRKAIAPWNLVGLCDPAKKNMYDYT
jgi:tetracycline 7-halogenase / FADH2 O2-dependent halogenase